MQKKNKGKSLYFVGCMVCLSLLSIILSACGDTPTARPTFQPPTAPPTPVDFESVAPAATIGGGQRTAEDTPSTFPTPFSNTLPAFGTPIVGDDEDNRGFVNADPTALALVFGTPGPGNTSAVKTGSGRPSRVNPTPTLNTSPGQVTVASLRNSRVSFLFAYRQALARVQVLQRNATIVFASANSLKPERTTWTFLFSWPEGRKTWRVIFDASSAQPQATLDLTEVATVMLSEAGQIDMTRVLDGDELVSRAESNGLRVSLPVDIVNFQIDGQSRQPSFVMTNAPQGKQIVLNAYTGAITRNDFRE